jgi:ATP-dependent Lon protease
LRDRLEVLELPGYIEDDKVEIAIQYLIPRQIEENGLKRKHIRFNRPVIRAIIQSYTREAGVRNLERQIAAICRKVARDVAAGDTSLHKIDKQNLRDFLGPAKYYSEIAEQRDEPGIVTGLAWTPTGGDILFVEATQMKGNKGLMLTGQLGDVMKESVQAALSFIRTNAENLGINPAFFEQLDVHVHVPAGAIPKDGPSAGVTMATALYSLFTQRPVRHDIAMTGEITLRGKVLPVGGIKEKVLAARRSGINKIVMPEKNRDDLEEVPENAKKNMTFYFVEHLSEVFNLAVRKRSLKKE